MRTATALPYGAVLVLALMAVVSAQTTPGRSQGPTSKDSAPAQDSVQALSAAVRSLADRLKKAEEANGNLAAQLALMKSENKEVTLDPTVLNQYVRLDSNAGFFAVSLQNVVPYLNGFRVTLNVGNLTSVRFSGFKIKATWGPKNDASNFTTWTEYLLRRLDQTQTRTFQFTETLVPAVWNKVDLILPATPPSQFETIEISMTTDTIYMAGG